mgnify:CR=1 FL=1
MYQSLIWRNPRKRPNFWLLDNSCKRSITASLSISNAANKSIVTSPGFSSSIRSLPIAAKFIFPILFAYKTLSMSKYLYLIIRFGEDHTSSSCLFEKASYSAKASSSAGSKCANLENQCYNELTIVIII